MDRRNEKYGDDVEKYISMPRFVNQTSGTDRRETSRPVREYQRQSQYQREPEFDRNQESEDSYLKQYKASSKKNVRRKKMKRKRMIRRIAFLCCLVLAVTGGYVSARLNYEVEETFSLMNRGDAKEMSIGIDESDLISDHDIVNILLIGSDERKSWNEPGRCDSTMIATLDNKNKRIKITSLMRDMYINIPEHGENRFNAAFAFGGVNLVYQTIAENFGIKLDGYVIVDFSGFKKVINAIGGVKIELNEKEYKYLTTAYKRGSVLDLKQGMNLMNGEQALAYTRMRQDIKGDFGRTERQRKVLNAIFLKVKSMSFNEILDLMKEVMPNITTDLTDSQIMSYVKTVLFLGTTDIDQFRIPVDNSYTPETIRKMKVLVPDVDRNKQELNQFIFSYDGEGIENNGGETGQ